MITLLYTDSDKALAAAGLSSDDLSDTFIAARDLPRIQSVDLYGWLPNHATLYIPPDTPQVSEAAKFRSDLLVLYSTHFCAAKLLQSALAVMAKESDGQNEYDRFSGLDLDQLATSMLGQAAYYRQTLLAEIHSLAVAPIVTLFSISNPSYDPVTG